MLALPGECELWCFSQDIVIRLWFEIFNGFFAFDDHVKRCRLNTASRKLGIVFNGQRSCNIKPNQPVALGSALCGAVEIIEFGAGF